MTFIALSTITRKPSEGRPVIREMVLDARTRELALRAGFSLPPISQLDHEQSPQVQSGEPELDRKGAVPASKAAATAVKNPTPVEKSAWTDTELDDSILRLCDEFPEARMAACSRALEYCRRSTPHGTRESLLTEMRDTLRLDMKRSGLLVAA